MHGTHYLRCCLIALQTQLMMHAESEVPEQGCEEQLLVLPKGHRCLALLQAAFSLLWMARAKGRRRSDS